MYAAAICSTIGYGLSLIGVALLWFYGMPYKWRTGGRSVMVTVQANEELKRTERQWDLYNKIGLGLVFLGTIGQVAGTWLASLPHQ